MSSTANDLIRLIQLGIITASNIKDLTVQAEVIAYYKAEVVAGTITTTQYKTYTGIDYVA